MSEQTKGNFQMIGAGLMGFVAVVGLAGLVLTHDSGRGSILSSAQTQKEYAPVSLVPSPALPRPALARETPRSSPAPLVGSVADEPVEESRAAAASASGAPEADAPRGGSALGELGAPRRAGRGESVSTAEASVKRIEEAGRAAGSAPSAKPVPRIKLDKTAVRGSIASSVHYGVTSRAELMGNSAGPVYNFSGRSVAGGSRFAELASESDAKLTEAERKIEQSDMTPEQKRAMREKLKSARQAVPR